MSGTEVIKVTTGNGKDYLVKFTDSSRTEVYSIVGITAGTVNPSSKLGRECLLLAKT